LYAYAVAAARDDTPSLAKMLLTHLSTVLPWSRPDRFGDRRASLTLFAVQVLHEALE
jgi:hypothetical protein